MTKKRYLTKSKFKLALDCPTKLYYASKPDQYENTRSDDPFLMALADGGFQVEELARMEFPDGVLIQAEHWQYDEAVNQTLELLKRENVVIFEAAFRFEHLFIRADVVVKTGNDIQLIEVKAKSYNPETTTFISAKGGLDGNWKPYLFDVAFQQYVIQKMCPEYFVTSFLMLADKTKRAKINQLNQCFRISKAGDKRKDTIRLVSSLAEIGGESVLSKIDVSEIVSGIHFGKYKYSGQFNEEFHELIQRFSDAYSIDIKMRPELGFSKCKSCEFKCKEGSLKSSGFKECWTSTYNWTDEEFNRPKLFEVWNFISGSKLFKEYQLIHMNELTKEIYPLKMDPNRLSGSERQWLQIEKVLESDDTIYVMKDELKAEMERWNFPLHFIDFETSMVAIPFNENRRPYEQVAFQFSHHKVTEEGVISHETEFINVQPGMFPNFAFVRALKAALGEVGTVFRYSNHENTVLNAIYNQLMDSDEMDKEDLCSFIRTITNRKSKKGYEWIGERNMVDLCEVYKSYYFDPNTKGSNSIKAVLPALMKRSAFLKNKYSQEIGEIGLTSKNFSASHIWLSPDETGVVNPYKSLPQVFDNWSNDELDEMLSNMDDLNNGGAALTAYGFIQYSDMNENERNSLANALLRYCELDTLAMVMIYEHFLEVVG
jgi:hypothetical protein